MNTGLKMLATMLLALGLLITGCAGGNSQVAVVGKTAPDFQLESPDGESTSLKSLRGKGTLVNFWQVRCPPCREEMPFIQQIYNEWSGKGLVVLAINIGESSSQVVEFMQSQGLSLPVLLDQKAEVARKYSIMAIPTTFFIDGDGIVQEKIIGAFQSKEQIENRLAQILP